MSLFRSLLYSFYQYALLAIIGIFGLPIAALGGVNATMRVAQAWFAASLFGLRIICGTRYEVRGEAHIPRGKFLIASKHQSPWETYFLARYFKHPIIVFKKELRRLPVFGWYIGHADMIEIDREAGASAIKTLLRGAEKYLSPERPLIIFPEGTRQEPGAPPDYKPGIAALYGKLGVPCLPVALNSGLYWDAKGFGRRPGKIIVEFLEPIAPGLPREAFMAELERRIETASNRLMTEGGFRGATKPSA